jgi:methylated-DNA-[protein]-cysteine S-methyltransferase
MATLLTTFDSPVGPLLAVGDGRALHGLHFHAGRRPPALARDCERRDEAFAELRAQLAEYFEGTRREFTIPLGPRGRPFEMRVWAALRDIAYGTTATYGQIAAQIGAAGHARAVGAANGRNPIAIIVPCHRVIGANGALTGYGGGLERKRWLLDLEAGVLALASDPAP